MSIEDQYNIWIDPDYLADNTRKFRIMVPEAYVMEVRLLLERLTKSSVGLALLETIRLWKRGVRIAPTNTYGVDVCGVEISDSVHGEQKDLDYNRNIFPSARLVSPRAVPFKAVVHFIPRLDMANNACKGFFNDPKKADYKPTIDEVLVHELTHAVRYLSDTFDGAQSDINVGSGSMMYVESGEEFIAVMVEDMFQSEKGANIRFSHDDFHTLDSAMQGSFEFYKMSKQAFATVDKFCKSSKFFAPRLSKLKVSFNPLAAYYKNPQKCKEMSDLSKVL